MFRHHLKTQRKNQACVDYSQHALLKKINLYRAAQKQSLLSMEGCCHGLTLLWLKTRGMKNSTRFYQYNEYIIDCQLEELSAHAQALEKFIKKIDKGQHPEYYFPDTHYTEVAKIIGAVSQCSLDGLYSRYELERLLLRNNHPNNMFCISSNTKYKHTVGICRQDAQYILYDANALSGRASTYYSTAGVVRCLELSLYAHFGLAVPDRMSLEIKMVGVSRTIGLFAKSEPRQQPKTAIKHGYHAKNII